MQERRIWTDFHGRHYKSLEVRAAKSDGQIQKYVSAISRP
jgi:hypothetical protein